MSIETSSTSVAKASCRPAEPLSGKDANWLEMAAFDCGSGMYPGVHWDMAPRRFSSLEKRGLVYLFMPHNPSHKYYAVATQKGREALVAYRCAIQARQVGSIGAVGHSDEVQKPTGKQP